MSNAQRELISFLIDAGADPNALDKSGVAPLHRAVRDRCSAGVQRAYRQGCRPATDEQEWLDPASPGCPEYGQEPLWVGCGQGGATSNHRVATRTRCQVQRFRRQGQDRCGGRLQRLDPSTARPPLINQNGCPQVLGECQCNVSGPCPPRRRPRSRRGCRRTGRRRRRRHRRPRR